LPRPRLVSTISLTHSLSHSLYYIDSTALHCTALYHSVLPYILYCTTLHCNVLMCDHVLYSIAPLS
jgi:hypothetical protein